MKYILLGKCIINIEQIAYIKFEEYDDTATVVMTNGVSYHTRNDIKYVLNLIKNAKPIEEIIKEIDIEI